MALRGFIFTMILAVLFCLIWVFTPKRKKEELTTVRDEYEKLNRRIDHSKSALDLKIFDQYDIPEYLKKYKKINPGKAEYFAGEMRANILNRLTEFDYPIYKK